MQSMMQFMPLLVGVFSWTLAAGLPLYWAVSTAFAIVQQYFITGWGQLLQRPSLGGGSLLGGGASRNGRQPRPRAQVAKAPPAPKVSNKPSRRNRARTRRG
jgi:membrane protein insertase Oxa1/YidC/SpoIIIJ